jgi:NhaA family Na+:H+ antiporter
VATASAKAPLPEKVVARVLTPVESFIRMESAGGIVLLVAAVLALGWANSPWREAYFALKEFPVSVAAGDFALEKHLMHWVNDLLMALFFFLVGLEIKRELLVGELADRRKAALPAAAALGGMVAPALIYAGLNWGGEGSAGWGVPMATDIAFAVGLLGLLGPRVPLPLKVFLLALAIVDDIGAVAVIAVVYTQNLDLNAFLLALAGWGVALFYGRARVTRPIVYILLGLVVWYFMDVSGVHATVAGVLMAFAVPIRHGMDSKELHDQTWSALREGEFEQVDVKMARLERTLEQGQSVLHRLERALGPYVAFAIMPTFALFNAGVTLVDDRGAGLAEALTAPVMLGVLAGLVVGKPLGIVGLAWLAVASGMAKLPDGVDWKAVTGVALLGGIGFTMALFIANLAFDRSADLLDHAKLGVLGASAIAALLGLAILAVVLPAPRREGSEARRQSPA